LRKLKAQFGKSIYNNSKYYFYLNFVAWKK
jgi:hypothetical protein